MTQPARIPPQGFDELTVEEQIEYVQALWDRIVANVSQIPVPEWHKELLDERLADLDANPDAGESWEEVRAQLHRPARRAPK